MSEVTSKKLAVLDQETNEITNSIRDHHIQLGQIRARIILLQNRRGDIEMEREQLAYQGTLEQEDQKSNEESEVNAQVDLGGEKRPNYTGLGQGLPSIG